VLISERFSSGLSVHRRAAKVERLEAGSSPVRAILACDSHIVSDRSIIIRKLEAADTAQFLAWRGWDEYTERIAREHLRQNAEGQRVILVALHGRTIVGTVQLLLNQDDLDLADGVTSGYLLALEVRDGFRRRGIATALFRALEAEAAARGLRRLTLMVEPDNEPALRFYHKTGFTPFKERTDFWRDREYRVLCMEKPITVRKE